MRKQHPLELLIPPPVVMLAAAGLGWLSIWLWPGGRLFQLPLPWVLVPVVLAGVIGTLAVLHCFRARTTVHPHCPEKTRCLVAYGVFRLSRNPMYLSLLLLLTAWMLQLGHLLSPLWLAGFVAYITRFQIRPEERVLKELFGDEYEAYCRATRRWI
ncbi:isoprenylcysteine carboxylmethyltransferase family protein [Marinobacterium sp. MBR-109]|jgi:protein-S-isoprenylcysteine O-methyltransferase Ste14|uniref:methyltransferase family protein n=1 Tax=Marinobacterium sp. MBR-109 TaxID=3156462 RepID=UPI0033944C74